MDHHLPIRPPAPATPPMVQSPARAASSSGDQATHEFFRHSTAKRVNTDTIIAKTLREQYPELELTTVPSYAVQLIPYARAGHASLELLEGGAEDKLPSSIMWKLFIPPSRRMDGDRGALAEQVLFGKFLLKWDGHEFLMYLVDGRDGTAAYGGTLNYYVLSTDQHRTDALLQAAGRWGNELHEEVWVFDGGYWQKSRELYESVRDASWDAVILDPKMKKEIIDDHMSFFSSRDTYQGFKVPWKRGIIYYGPPGNGKTISIKAMMHTFYSLKEPIPTLYVRSLASFGGPEYAISQIFGMARRYAPCYLVFEDLDSIVTDQVRSYFLNEVDGLKSNDGIFMIGSTNHLDRLDPGIAKRPSRFDRKYFFPDPNKDERTAYCRFWQAKLADNKGVDFPDKLCTAIAEITDDFSFAYMQEAFVAALLALARQRKDGGRESGRVDEDILDGWVGVRGGGGDDLDKNALWVEIQKQVEILREGMEKKK